MPKWTEYTSKDTLADNDEVMLYDATGKANKRGLMSKFWDYVVDKMATAVISKLETDNKTIIGAINVLNGKRLECKRFPSSSNETIVLEYASKILQTDEVSVEIIGTSNIIDGSIYSYSPGLILHNYDTCAILLVNYANGNIQTNVRSRSGNWKGWKEFTRA